MLSVLIEMRDDDAAKLAATLGCLVPAAVEGLVRDVVVVEAGIGPQGRHVAEHAGCAVRPVRELGEALAETKGEWVLGLEAGCELLPGWIETVARHVGIDGRDRGARFRPAARRRAAFAWTRIFVRSPKLARGVLAPRGEFVQLFRGGTTLRELAEKVATRPLDASILSPERGARV